MRQAMKQENGDAGKEKLTGTAQSRGAQSRVGSLIAVSAGQLRADPDDAVRH
jgi:hypothetical protein